MMKILWIPFFLVALFACTDQNEANLPKINQTPSAEEVLDAAYVAHGCDSIFGNSFSFDFRENCYTFDYNKTGFIYTKRSLKLGENRVDSLINGRLVRYQSGEESLLTAEEQNKYAESINSVIYFATLPYKLKDKAVNSERVGSRVLRGETYDLLKVTFDQEGGGTDHDDEFMYWVNRTTHLIDYLAYSYNVNGGGVRFRAATNPTVVRGVRFQDYINYGAPNDTPLSELLFMYEEGKLDQLSEIELENIAVK